MVLTENGYKKMSEITTGEKVLTHTNTYEEVLDKKCTGKKQIWTIKGMCVDEIKCTQNHKFYVREMKRHYPTYKNGKRGNVRTFSQPKWVPCCELTKKHYLGVAINQNSIIPKWDGIKFVWKDGRKPRVSNVLSNLISNRDFWWVVGRYLGDGWIRTQGGIIICCAKDEIEEVSSYLKKCNLHYSAIEERTVFKMHIPLKELSEFLKPYGIGAKNKKLPGYVFDMPIHLLDGLICGYASADGYSSNGLIKLASISKELSYGMAQIIAKTYKTPYRIYKNHRKRKCIIEGRICNQNDGYEVVFKKEKKKQDKAFYENGYVWYPIQKIEQTNECEMVYDIEVENSHSFTANGTIAHNCTDLSVAGKQAGMSKGSGTRSGLLWEVERLLTEIKDSSGELPQILFMENVPQVHSNDNMADFRNWIDFLDSLGYTSYRRDLNAKNYGVAQNRERCFMFSFLGEYNYHFPEPISLEKKLKDYLEDEVDEKYYLNNEKAEKLIKQLIDTGALPNTIPQSRAEQSRAEQSRAEQSRLALTEQSTSHNQEKSQTASQQDTIAEFQTNSKQETLWLSNQATKVEKIADVAVTLMSRDYKGFGNQTANGVIEWK